MCIGIPAEFIPSNVKFVFRSPRTDNGDDAYVVNSYGDVYHGSWDVSHSDGIIINSPNLDDNNEHAYFVSRNGDVVYDYVNMDWYS